MITLQEFRFYVSVYKIVKLLVIDKYTRKSYSCLCAGSVGLLGVLVTVAAAVCVCSCRSHSRAALRPKLSIPII